MIIPHRTALVLVVAVAFFGAGAARAQMPPPVAVAPAPAPAPEEKLPVRLAVQVEAASGVVTGEFKNQLLGGRVDVAFSPRLTLGGYLGFASLKGKDGRARSALTYAQLEYMFGGEGATVRYPLRFASGYLGGNGPIVRIATGFAFRLSPTMDLVTELLAPMVWFTNNQTLLSMNLSLELRFRI